MIWMLAILLAATLAASLSVKISIDAMAAALARQYAEDVAMMQLCAADRRVVRYTPPRPRSAPHVAGVHPVKRFRSGGR
jgi:hypothetical protein